MLVVEALLRAWRVDHATWRLRLRLVPLAVPLLIVPLFFLAAPWRQEPWFVSGWALFAAERWNVMTVGGRDAGGLILLISAGVGAALFLRDALPLLVDSRKRRLDEEIGPWAFVPPHLQAILDRQAAVHGVAPPALRLVRSSWPVLLCEGHRTPEVVLSTATLQVLEPNELEAAVAHELVHARYRDPAWGYALIAARSLGFYNPALQWAARAVVDELERRADQAVVAAGGDPCALASAIVKLFDGSRPAGAAGGAMTRAGWRAHAIGVERRSARLVSSPGPARPAFGWLRVALAAGGLAAMLFFVV